jgi:TPR repeat protein
MIKVVTAGFVLVVISGLLSGCGTAPLVVGVDAFHDGDFAAAQAQWQPLAEDGNVHAQHNLGVLYKAEGDLQTAAFWWEQAVAGQFVPSMLELGALKLISGKDDAAEALYRRAARWGSKDAVAVLEAWQRPVPHADLFFARHQAFRYQQGRIASYIDQPDPNEYLNRVLDYNAAVSENDD